MACCKNVSVAAAHDAVDGLIWIVISVQCDRDKIESEAEPGQRRCEDRSDQYGTPMTANQDLRTKCWT
jgi:hypothetical protein